MPESELRQWQEIEAKADSIEDEMSSLNATCGSIKQQILALKKAPKNLSREIEQLRLEVKMLKLSAIAKELPGIEAPVREDYQAAMKKLKYAMGYSHIGFAGCAGVGKSSLLNAIRGLRNKDRRAAPTGYSETPEIGRYPALENDGLIYYDIPGKAPFSFWDYFKEYGLYLMQAIVIIWCDRITARDVGIMACCLIADIPFLLVRSKCDQYIADIRRDVADNLDLDECDLSAAKNPRFISALAHRVSVFQVDSREAAKKMIDAAYKDVNRLVPANHPYEERVLLVNSRSMYKWMTEGYEDANAIDEKRFEECLLRLCA